MRTRIFTILIIVVGGVILSVWTISTRSKHGPGSTRALDHLAKVPARVPFPANFTKGTATARKFGTHEIELTDHNSVSNPFATVATVIFTPPSGQIVTVYAFYDGGNVWRARVYVTEVGVWWWASTSFDSPDLHNKSGSFVALDSDLRGMLRKHNQNPKYWMTDDGQGFINLSDTAYLFFDGTESHWQDYVHDIVALGITSMRSDAFSGWGIWTDNDWTRYKLEKFQIIDARLQWLLDNYPYMYVLVGLLPGPLEYGTDETVWANLPQTVRDNTLRYLIARWAAYPQLFFEVFSDTRVSPAYPNNQAMAREVGNYFKNNDPWKHLISVGPTRDEPFPFTSPQDDWVGFILLETSYALSADQVQAYARFPLPIFNEEDYYEQDPRPGRKPLNPRYFYRRLFWAWLLAGASPNYGGRWGALHPYTQTGLLTWTIERQKVTGTVEGQKITGQQIGLDSLPYIASYFAFRRIELWPFQPDDSVVQDLDGETGSARPKAARRSNKEYLFYHPNAKSGERLGGDRASVEAKSRRDAALDITKPARLRVNLTAAVGAFRVEWFRTHDGVAQDGGLILGGEHRDFVAPWRGYDVVLRLLSVADR